MRSSMRKHQDADLAFCDSISTHLTLEEKEALYELSSRLKDHSIAVEIGSYLGASACFIASGLNNTSRLYCIDSWQNDGMSEGNKDTYLAFCENTAKHRDKIVPVRGMSVEVHEWVKNDIDGTIDLLFIDGDHAYEGVKKDWELYSPMLGSGSVVIFHDVSWAEGVKRVIREDVKKIVYRDSDYAMPNMYWAYIK